MKILVTGGAGFIGSCYVTERTNSGDNVLNLDKLTYSGNLDNLMDVRLENYAFVQGDIGDRELVKKILREFQPEAVVNFAAETHVDRSILYPDQFIETNVVGTSHFLSEVLQYWNKLTEKQKNKFRFLHISTDEVFGTLNLKDPPFSEITPYKPNSPYSASKASSDHLVRAFHETFGLPTLITNCSNNYGPRQFPEKLIPLMILNAITGKELPIYGNGSNIRDWLHVKDHCDAIHLVLTKATPGQTYNIGGNSQRSNLQVVEALIQILDRICPNLSGKSYRNQIRYVKDRPGHDLRYAINANKIKRELGWSPRYTFEIGIEETVLWYLDNTEWVKRIMNGSYKDWIYKNYTELR